MLLAALLVVAAPLYSQKVSHNVSPDASKKGGFVLDARELILPFALIGAGAVAGQIDAVKELDFGLRGNLPCVKDGFVLEDAVQYAPVAVFYGLNMLGVKSAHSVKDGTALALTSYCITAATTLAFKSVVDELRPNGVDYDAFPSGHAAVSFMGAELLRLEYKDSAPWVGYAGYAAAVYTSLARIKHYEHWFHDLVAGAGVGILGTRVAYLVAPWVHEKLALKSVGRKGGDCAMLGVPYYNGTFAGVSFSMVF